MVITPASQAGDDGSIPFTRSTFSYAGSGPRSRLTLYIQRPSSHVMGTLCTSGSCEYAFSMPFSGLANYLAARQLDTITLSGTRFQLDYHHIHAVLDQFPPDLL